jgi:hypothetical protein
MSRSLADSRIALILRRLQGRFGISAPRVAVRTHIPWNLRIIGFVVMIIFSLMLAAWAYDAGRRMAGFNRSESSHVVDELRLANAALEEEVARLRSLLTASESSLQIEQAAQKLLSEQNRSLVDENARIREDQAVFERLVKIESKVVAGKAAIGKAEDEIMLDRLSVRPGDVLGHYRFSFLIALQGHRRGKETRLNVQIVITPRAGTADAKIMLPRRDDPNIAQYEVLLRNFRRIDGKFEIPAAIAISSVEFRIFETGVLLASKSFNL